MSQARRPRSARILVVDDDPGLLRLLTIRLRSEKYTVEPADSAATALAAVTRFRPDLVITDLRMTEMDGIALLKELQRRWPSLNVIVLTAHGTIPDAVQATHSGAFAFLTKPIDKEQLLEQVRRALKTSGFADAADDWRSDFATRSPVLEDCLAHAFVVASTDVPVILTGEPGTGKELLAQSIHRASRRNQSPFVSLDCTSIPDVNGVREITEALQRAEGGTLYLRNVDDLPASGPTELSRVLSEGDSTSRNVRMVVSVDRPSGEPTPGSGLVRDLHDRFSAARIELPPISKRLEDLPLIVAQCLEQIARETGIPKKTCSPEGMEALAAARWPGNVRQVIGVVRDAAMKSATSVITAEHVYQALGLTSQLPSFDEARDEFTRQYLTQLLQLTEGNVSRAARLARRNRTDFYKLLTRYGLDPDSFKQR